MRTEKLYDENPYLKEFSAEISGVENTKEGILIELDRTLFFPEEGGQSSDTGFLWPEELESGAGQGLSKPGTQEREMLKEKTGRFEIIHVSIKDGRILHLARPEGAETGSGSEGSDILLQKGLRVRGRIDWRRRFSNMQNHTGEHILSGILHRDYGSENTGFHLSDNIVTLDTSKQLDRSVIRELERKANEAVYADIPITCCYYAARSEELKDIEYRSKKELNEDVRLVTIPGIDICACCAPHVSGTGQVGIIKVINAVNYKGGTRLTILSGRRAFEYLSTVHDITRELTHKLSVSPERLTEAVDKVLKELNDIKLEKAELAGKRLLRRIDELSGDLKTAVIFTEDTTVNNITQRNAVNILAERHKGICAVFVGKGEYRFILAHPEGDARETAKLLKDRFGARCGGSKEMIQGSISADEEELTAFFDSLATTGRSERERRI